MMNAPVGVSVSISGKLYIKYSLSQIIRPVDTVEDAAEIIEDFLIKIKTNIDLEKTRKIKE